MKVLLILEKMEGINVTYSLSERISVSNEASSCNNCGECKPPSSASTTYENSDSIQNHKTTEASEGEM